MGLLSCMGAQSAFFGPLKYSILPDHLEEKDLIGANALVEAGTFLAILLGTILGGILILRDGGVVMISSCIFLAALAGWSASRKIPKAPARDPSLKVNYNIVTETWKLASRVRENKDVFLAIMGISWFWLVGFTFLAQFPVYASDVLGADEGVVTLFLTVFSIGIAFGSLLCNKLLKGEVSGVLVPFALTGMTVSIFAFWFATPLSPMADALIGITAFLQQVRGWLILAGLMAVSVFGGMYIVPLYAIMQAWSEDSHRSRTIAVNNIMNALFMVAGAVLTMFALKLNMRIQDVFLVLAVFNIPVGFLVRRIVNHRRKEKGLPC
ncbi:MAG: MFS transporter [Alphaproteobacteria bacterium]|nr:MFS transporter [Alphaproteobacteria bacterium]